MKFSELLVEYLELRDDAKDDEYINLSRREQMADLLSELDNLIERTAP